MMTLYSIQDLEKITGIQKKRIQLWINNFDLLHAELVENGIEYFNEIQLKKLIKVGSLIQNGFSISDISHLSTNEIDKIINNLIALPNELKEGNILLVNEMLAAAVSFNQEQFEKAFEIALSQQDLATSYQEVIYPVLVRIGMMWSNETLVPKQEQFLTELIKKKIYFHINQLRQPSVLNETWLLYLPESEDHEIGLLIASYILQCNNNRVIYLGKKIKFKMLKESVSKYSPDCLLYFIVQNRSSSDIQHYIDQLKLEFSTIKIFIAGNPSLKHQIILPKNYFWVDSIGALENLCNAE